MIVIYKAAEVTVGLIDPLAAVHNGPVPIVPEERKHTSHKLEGAELLDDKIHKT